MTTGTTTFLDLPPVDAFAWECFETDSFFDREPDAFVWLFWGAETAIAIRAGAGGGRALECWLTEGAGRGTGDGNTDGSVEKRLSVGDGLDLIDASGTTTIRSEE